jgi:hypothetical protein
MQPYFTQLEDIRRRLVLKLYRGFMLTKKEDFNPTYKFKDPNTLPTVGVFGGDV